MWQSKSSTDAVVLSSSLSDAFLSATALFYTTSSIMVAFAILAPLLAGASLVLGTPLAPQLGNCDVTKATPFLPSGQTNVTVPSGQTPSKITVGVGVQNYTCSSSGTYTFVLLFLQSPRTPY